MKLCSFFLPLGLYVVASSAFNCTTSALDSILPSHASALFATPVQANGTFGQAGDIGYPKHATNLPPLCAVSVNVTSSATTSFTFGLFLPYNWNGRFLTVGNGAFTGGINWLDMGAGVQYGFAVISTNTGHNGTGANSTFALNSSDAKLDWLYRALHSSIIVAKQVVQ